MTDPGAIERFTALYDEHYRSVYAYAVSRAGRQLADEVAGEVFLIAWRRLADMPWPALPWLLGVTRNVVIGQFRVAARQQSIAAEMRAWVASAGAGQVAGDVADEVSDRLTALRALASLSEADRELLTLVAWHGLAPREAAQVVGCSTAAYFVRLHRARRRLEQAMDHPPGPAADGAARAADSRKSPGAVRRAAKTPDGTCQAASPPDGTCQAASAPDGTCQAASAPDGNPAVLAASEGERSR